MPGVPGRFRRLFAEEGGLELGFVWELGAEPDIIWLQGWRSEDEKQRVGAVLQNKINKQGFQIQTDGWFGENTQEKQLVYF